MALAEQEKAVRQSMMRREILEIPVVVERLLTQGAAEIAEAAGAIRERDPRFAVTVARGSSDHVCTYLQYGFELLASVPVASIGPAVASIYNASLKLQSSVSVSVSQSGQSPDIVEMARATRRDGALSLAITNDPCSPLADACDRTLAIHAGVERSVAATKTFVASVVAGLELLAQWRRDDALKAAVVNLPARLSRAAEIDWPELRAAIGGCSSVFTLGRGPGLAISNEAALKFKETCRIHAESYSSAEVLHGPVSIVDRAFPVLCFAVQDPAERGVVDVADRLAEKGANVFVTSARARHANVLHSVGADHYLTDPLTLIVSFYAMVERLAAERGIDPDKPRHLKKITETR